MKTFTVTHPIAPEVLSDVLCSALEGGSNYWCDQVGRVEPRRWEFKSEPHPEPGKHWMPDYPLNPGGALLLNDLEDEERNPLRLDEEAVSRGLAVLSEKYPHHVADMLSENTDADTGDALLQCCLFGDIIYG